MEQSEFEPVYREIFPFWGEISGGDRTYICQNSYAVAYPKGQNVHDGNECSGVIFVRSGSLRTYMLSEEGKDITLYRLYKGDMCMLSASCVLKAITFDVLIDAEEDSECYVIGGPAFAVVSERNPCIKIFALETAVGRFSDVMWVMQQNYHIGAHGVIKYNTFDYSAAAAPGKRKSMHDKVTKKDIERMRQEIEYRKLVVRKEALEVVKEARSHGDLSENFEYHAAKKDKNANESRIRYLERMIKTAIVVSDDSKSDEAGLNNRVTVYFEDEDEEETYTLVTTVRGNSINGWISTESPLGKAVLGHKEGERVYVKVSDTAGYYVEIRKIENAEDDGSIGLRRF